MLNDPSEVEVGTVVYLTPRTKLAGREEQARLTVRIMKDPKRHWPMLAVEWTDPTGQMQWRLVHRDNINRRESAAVSKKDGDGSNQTAPPNRVRVMPGKYEPIDPKDGVEETLF